jgi:WD40 repeat protein
MNGLVASCSNDNTVNIWNPKTGELIRKYTKHTETINGLDQIDKDKLVSGSYDNTIHIWEISTGLTLNIINVSDSVNYVKSLSNGLIACVLHENINIYEWSTGYLTKTLSGHYNSVYTVELLNEQFMASGGWDKNVFIWDLYSYSIKYTLTQHKNAVLHVKRLSSSLIASGDNKGLIIIWNWLNGSLVHTLKGHTYCVSSLDLYDDQTLISGSVDQTIKLWDISNGQLIKTINTDMEIRALAMLQRSKKKHLSLFNLLLLRKTIKLQ